MRTTRVSNWCEDALAAGPKNTDELIDYVNEKSKHGTTPRGLGNVLAKDRHGRFLQIGEEVVWRGDVKSKVAVWMLKPKK